MPYQESVTANLLGHLADGATHTARLLAWLAGQGVTPIGAVRPRTVIVGFRGQWYTLHDNGGEVSVERINADDTHRDVPVSENYDETIERLGYRLLACLRGEPIDWTLDFPEGGKLCPASL